MEENTPHRRRIVRRRNGFGFSGNNINQSTAAESDIHEDVVSDLNSSTRQLAAVPVQPIYEETVEFDPRTRLRLASQRSVDYEKELRLNLLHKYLLRGLQLDEISERLGIPISRIEKDRRELAVRLRQHAKDLDIDMLVGNSKGFYEEVQSLAMKQAVSPSVPTPIKLSAMRTALASHNDMHRFYQAAGVYDVLRFKKGIGDGVQSDIQRLMSMTDDLLTEARREKEGSKSLGEFSNTDSETVDL